MALGENNGGPDFPVDEWGDMARVASMLEDLVDEGLTIEAMVRLKRLRIADQAEALVRISTEAQTALLDVLPSEDLGAIIEDLEVEEAVAFCERLAIDKLPVIFDAASPHIAADVLRALEPASAEDVIAEMETAPDVIPLLEYEDDAAGGLMTPEFVALRETMTVEQALDFVRLWAREIGPDPEYLHYLFVVDWEGALKGGLSLAQLVLASRGQFVSLLMDEDIISVGVETDQEEAARLMERYDIFNLPVVDDDGRLVGVVWLDDMIRVLDDEATEDMFRMIGLDQEEKALGPFWRSVRNRLPWLVVNLGTAVLAGYVITLFQSTMGQVVALAAFLPVIAGQGGIAGTQTLTLIIRSITLGEVSPANARQLLLKELGLGLVHGLALGLVVGLIAFIWKGSEYLALVVGIAMTANLVVAGISGVVVPLGFRALRIDPALSSAVAVTTLTDVLGFLVYLGLATAAIGLIVGSL